VLYPNPSDGRDTTLSFVINKPVSSVTVDVMTPANRSIYHDVFLGNATGVSTSIRPSGGFSIGQNAVRLSVQSMHLANGLYYVVLRLPDGTKSNGKWVVVR
jgi:hypothetical protein